MLSKSQIVERLVEKGVGQKQQIKHVLDGLAEVAAEEIALGEDFQVPGVARIAFRYTKPRRKGEEYVGFGGEVMKADVARPAKVRMVATPVGSLKNSVKESLTDNKSKLFKAVAKKKG